VNHVIAHLLVRAAALTHHKTPEVYLAEQLNQAGQVDASLAKRNVARFRGAFPQIARGVKSFKCPQARRALYDLHTSTTSAPPDARWPVSGTR
jgi:hypothetical protein